MKVKYFFKRLIYRGLKRFLRFFIFFSVFLSLLTSFCFAVPVKSGYEYEQFSDLVADGQVRVHAGYKNNLLTKVNELYGSSVNNIIITEEDIEAAGKEYINSFRIEVRNSSNVMQNFSSNDVLLINQTFRVTSSNIDVSTFRENFQMHIGYSYIGSDDLPYTNEIIVNASDLTDFGTVADSSNTILTARILGSIRLPNLSGRIEYISYDFYQYTTSAVYVDIFPNYRSVITYYVGDSSGAPKYTAIDSSKTDDFTDAEDELIGSVGGSDDANNSLNGFNDGLTGDGGLFKNADIIECLKFYYDLFEFTLKDNQWIRWIVYLSISLGMFGFIVSVSTTSLSRISRNEARSRYNKGGAD